MSFPDGIVSVLAEHLLATPTGPSVTALSVVERQVYPTDANGTIGVGVLEWVPNDPDEIGSMEPTFSRYHFVIQALTKHADKEAGERIHSVLSKSVRTMLYRYEPLRVALHQLSDSEGGVTERVMRWGVGRQQFRAAEIKGSMTFVSHLALWVEVSAQ